MIDERTKGRVLSETLIQSIGTDLLRKAQSAEKKIALSHPWETKLLGWCMQNEELKINIFRFIDVLPSLTSSRDVAKHLKEYFPSNGSRLPPEIRAGLMLARTGPLTAPLIQKTTRWIHRRMAQFFIGADSIESALEVTEQCEAKGFTASIDLLGELVVSEPEAVHYENQYVKLIDALGKRKKGLAYQNISLKLTALDPCFDPIDPEGTSARVRKRLIPLLERAVREQVFVFIDMEHYGVRDITLDIVKQLLRERPDFMAHVGIVIQAYLTDAREISKNILRWLEQFPKDSTHAPLTVRLVRGAYWDSEIMKAEEQGWPVPVFTDKIETDQCYEELTDFFLAHAEHFRLSVATHNIRSVARAMAWAETNERSKSSVEFQLLYGLGEPLQEAIATRGYPVRLYMPVGDPLPGMSYLVRRLLENVSQQSFLRKSFSEASSPTDLLKSPEVPWRRVKPLAFLKRDDETQKRFQNEPVLDFSKAETRAAFSRAIKETGRTLGFKIPLWIGGKEVFASQRGLSLNPSWPSQVVAEYSAASTLHAEQAVRTADKAFHDWSRTGAEKRAELLRRTAVIIRKKRMELAAVEMYEVGKPWREADGDVVEAIDFLEFYASEALRYERSKDTDRLSHESNFVSTHARGVAAIISPWNFPLAILTGMSSAALASGNPVILKPAEQSSFVAWHLMQAYREAGFPEGVVQMLTGSGPDLGPVLIEDPRVSIIAFTGSRDVGLDIYRRAAASQGKSGIKKVIAELGGKNAIIVDTSADFDQAISGVLESAFGYAGQKCSAASRLILIEPIARPFLKRLTEAASTMTLGDPLRPETRVGPLIDSESVKRLRLALAEAKKFGSVLYSADLGNLKDQGYFSPPTIVGNLPDSSPLLQQELFGPFLIVSIARDFNEALTLANRSDYALTGGVFSRTPSHIEQAKMNFNVGNLYINRKITGAVVKRQPFGGYRMSGGGSKAGGMDYLREFMVVRTVSENRMRHGFAPLGTRERTSKAQV